MRNQTILTPFFLDQPRPQLLSLAQPGWLINEPDLPAGTQQRRMSAIHRPLADRVYQLAGDGHRPVSIAGDCCTTIGVVAGLQRAGIEPLLIWFDAHGDFNTSETSPSGFIGGMPLAMIVGRGEQTMPAAAALEPLPESDVLLCDARDLDPGECDLVAGSNLTHLNSVERLLTYPIPKRPVYVHFDTDVLTPEDAPAMNYTAPGGPSAKTLGRVFDHLANTASIVAVSMSTWEPVLDRDGTSREICMQLLGAF